MSFRSSLISERMFLYIDPLKQGLNITLTDNTDCTDKRLFVLNWELK